MRVGSMMYSGRSRCLIPRDLPTNENHLDDRPQRTGRLFLVACRIRIHRYFSAIDRVLQLHGRTILRTRIGGSSRILCVASLALSLSGSSRRDAALVRGTAPRHDGAAVHYACHYLAGDPRQIPRELVVSAYRPAIDLPDGSHGRVPGSPGSWPDH